MTNSLKIAALALPISLFAVSTQASPFTGPSEDYYLNNYSNNTIYVVQGSGVVQQFPWAYNNAQYSEGNLALANGGIVTNGFGSQHGPLGIAGQYNFNGTPTGASHTAQETPGLGGGQIGEEQYDGTSDGVHNYTIDYGTGIVIQTDTNWQNPTPIFNTRDLYGLGITYDRFNNSLWISDFGSLDDPGPGRIYDYSLSGTLLYQFSTDTSFVSALAFNAMDNTLWFSKDETNYLEQWSTNGVLLQAGIPAGLPTGKYLAGEIVPEPSSLALLGISFIGIGFLAYRRRLPALTA